ncbi:hypothetical protein [Simkania sp.]|uniref:hypothetical protein n=1 Tax=Simkania sp. TaxID=34094 RepID=UPI003B520400
MENDNYGSKIKTFQEEYPEGKCFFVIPGKRRENDRGFPVIPMEEFLLNITPGSPIYD